MPPLLERGRASELVQEAHADEFLDPVPHAHDAGVAGVRNMGAGDRNNLSAAAIVNFINRLGPWR